MKIIFIILVTHYVADFILQSHEQAINKSKSFVALLGHVLTYALAFLPVALCIFPDISVALVWWGFNMMMHFFTDMATSKINASVYDEKCLRNLFIGVGADQLIHYITLFGSYSLLAN